MRRSRVSEAPKSEPFLEPDAPKRPRESQTVRRRRDEEVTIPIDDVNEMIVVAAALVDHEARKRLVRRLPPESFFGRGHRAIWTMIAELDRRQLSYDPLTVASIDPDVDTKYLNGLIQDRPASPPNLEHHVECVEWDRQRSDFVKGPLNTMVDALKERKSDPDKVRAISKQIGKFFAAPSRQKHLRDGHQLVEEQMREVRTRREGIAVYPFGIEGFDRYEDDHEQHAGRWRIIPGAAPGCTTVVTGLSGSGKSTFTAHLVLGQVNAGRRVLWGAWEQGSGATLEQVATISLGLSRARGREGLFRPEEERELELEMERIAQLATFFEIPIGGEVRRKKNGSDAALDLIHEKIEQTGADVFVGDLFRRALTNFDPEEEELMLYRQQAMAQQTKCHNILIQQLRLKDVEQRTDKRPTREGIKGSGAWTEIADLVVGVHRQAQFRSVPDDRLEAIILKQRWGAWPLAVEFEWDAEHGTIRNGRSIAYSQTGQDEMSEMMGIGNTNGKKRGGRR